MYAAIQPDGFVVFRNVNTLQVGDPPSRNRSAGRSDGYPRGTPVNASDMWWTLFSDDNEDLKEEETDTDWQDERSDWNSRFRIKVATIGPTRRPVTTTSTTTSTTPQPRRPTSKKHKFYPQDYDDGMTYNYKSYQPSGSWIWAEVDCWSLLSIFFSNLSNFKFRINLLFICVCIVLCDTVRKRLLTLVLSVLYSDCGMTTAMSNQTNRLPMFAGILKHLAFRFGIIHS